ncbi:Fc receptor-like protein 5 [Synchiropus splendidus]|uniref:Fc receptor-like protein 5 n=1 Tax=Synchiropus splendidus TaxID=270530 RepID=UPI00237E1C79|nr:Fc receptor-like protein 5 [Synchiropus splendidus]
MAYIGSRVSFRCVSSNLSQPVTYHLLKNGDPAQGIQHSGHPPWSFSFRVTEASEGWYQCKVKSRGRAEVSNSLRLRVVIPPSETVVTTEPSPLVVFEGFRFVLSCGVMKGTHLYFTWFFNRTEVTSTTSPLLNITGNKLVVSNATAEHAGSYYCIAWSQVQNTRRFSSSTEIVVGVRVYFVEPTISFFIYKNGPGYRGNVSCRASRGSPPANFSLLIDDEEVQSVTSADSRAVWFSITAEPGLDMGLGRCRVKTEAQDLTSEPVSLEVVPVGGTIKVEVEYLYGADSKLAAARLKCLLSRGSFPLISWMMNDSLLTFEHHHLASPPHFVLTDHRRTLVLAKVGPQETAYYRCKARDRYDESGVWLESPPVLVRVPGGITTAVDFISIAFCGFLFLFLVVGVFCVFRILEQKQFASSNYGYYAATRRSSFAHPLSATRFRSDSFFSERDVNHQGSEITL